MANNDFFSIKLRNEDEGEYVYIYGKVDKTPTTFGHVKKYNIYGELKQSQVAINKKVALNIEYISKDDKEIIEKWWENKATIWIEQDNKIPILSTFIDSDFALKEDYNSESDEIYYNGTLNFE